MTSELNYPSRVSDATRGPAKMRARLASAWLSAALIFACSGARLDPEKNQALTFDTVRTVPNDAGVDFVTPVSMRRANASQLAPEPQREGTLTPPNSTLPAPANPTSPAPEPIRCTQDPPDPKPVSTRDWAALEFAYVEGTARLQASRRVHTAKPRDSARIVGRYAVELWIGCELIDRIRFSFPLQAAEAPHRTGTRRALHEPPSLTARARLSTTVFVPLSERATRAELVDRNAGTRVALAWPPDLSSAAPEKPRLGASSHQK